MNLKEIRTEIINLENKLESHNNTIDAYEKLLKPETSLNAIEFNDGYKIYHNVWKDLMDCIKIDKVQLQALLDVEKQGLKTTQYEIALLEIKFTDSINIVIDELPKGKKLIELIDLIGDHDYQEDFRKMLDLIYNNFEIVLNSKGVDFGEFFFNYDIVDRDVSMSETETEYTVVFGWFDGFIGYGLVDTYLRKLNINDCNFYMINNCIKMTCKK